MKKLARRNAKVSFTFQSSVFSMNRFHLPCKKFTNGIVITIFKQKGFGMCHACV